MIEKVVIGCFKKDIHLVRTCVASIRYWYPEVEVLLLKDLSQGDFPVIEFENYWKCKVFNTPLKHFGWGWSKYALIFHPIKEKYLFVDSDVVFLGRVLQRLNAIDADFIVTGIQGEPEDSQNVNSNYLDIKKAKALDPLYEFPGFAFNTGQIVISSDLLTQDDFSTVMSFENRYKNLYPDIFKHSDQGIINYVLWKCHQKRKINLAYEDFWLWPGVPMAKEIELEKIKNTEGYPLILHWAGIKPVDFRKYLRYDILQFFESYYYDNIPMGGIKRMLSHYSRLLYAKIKIAKYIVMQQKYA